MPEIFRKTDPFFRKLNFVTFDDVMTICLMMMDQWMEDDAGEPALNKDFLSGLRDLKVKSKMDVGISSCFKNLFCTILPN